MLTHESASVIVLTISSIEDVNLTTSIALEKCDPTAYGIGFYEFVQSEELDDERNGRDSPLDG